MALLTKEVKETFHPAYEKYVEQNRLTKLANPDGTCEPKKDCKGNHLKDGGGNLIYENVPVESLLSFDAWVKKQVADIVKALLTNVATKALEATSGVSIAERVVRDELIKFYEGLATEVK